MATHTGTLSPDAILETTNWASGTVTSIQDDPTTPDANWLVATANSSPILRVSFPSPNPSTVTLSTTASSQTFRVWARASGTATAGQTLQIQLYQNGTLVSSGAVTTISNATGQLVSYTWTPSANDDGSNVECRVVIVGVPSGAKKGSVDIGAVAWDYNSVDVVVLPVDSTNMITPVLVFPFDGGAWKDVTVKAKAQTNNARQVRLVVEWSKTSSTLATFTKTQSAMFSSGTTSANATTLLLDLGTVNFADTNIIYWRCYISDDTVTSNKTAIFSFKYSPNYGFSPATQWMQQGNNTDFVRAIDVSSLQGTIDWVAVKNSGVNYALLRCYGVDHTANGDGNFETYVTNAKSAGVKTGGYFYLNVLFPYNIADAHTEADKFIAKLQSGYGTGQYGDFMPFIDLEDNTGHVTAGQTNLDITVEQLIQWVNEFRNYFETQTGRKLGIYVPDYFVRDQRNNFNHDDATNGPVAGTSGNLLKDMVLWASGFTSYDRYRGGVMPYFGGWTKWQAFQHGDTNLTPPGWTLSGITGTVDLDWILPQTEVIMPPSNVSGLVGSDNGTDIILSWTASPETDVHKWDIYVDDAKVGTSTTNGSYTIASPTTGVSHTIKVVPIDDWGDDPVTAPSSITYTLGTPAPTNPPKVNSLTVDHTKISKQITSNVTFSFDKPVKAYKINVNGTSYNTGTVIAQGTAIVSGGTTVGNDAIMTVSSMAGQTVLSLGGTTTPIASGTAVRVIIDWSEMAIEGDNRVNIYGQSQADNSWTAYNTTLPDVIPSGQVFTMSPTSIVDVSGWTGLPLSSITDVPPNGYASDSTSWSLASSNSTSDVHVTLGIDPMNTTLVGQQKLRISYFKNNGYNVSLTISVIENGTTIATTTYSPTTNEKGMLELPFDASLLTDKSGSSIKAYVSTTTYIDNSVGTTYWRNDLMGVGFVFAT
jgi:lysozyme